MIPGAKQAWREALLCAGTALGTLALIYFHHDISAALHGSAVFEQLEGAASPSKRTPKIAAMATGFDRKVRIGADARGHFMLDAAINDHPITMMADTGATLVMLTFEDAERIGLSPRSLDFSGQTRIADGALRVATLTLPRLRVAGITLRDVPAVVAEPGALGVNLLGMSFLGRLKRFEMQRGELLLVQ